MIEVGDVIRFKFNDDTIGVVYRKFSPNPQMYLANVFWFGEKGPMAPYYERISTVNLSVVEKYDKNR